MVVPTSVDLALFAIFFVVLILPFKVKIVERNLEAFLLLMGGLAVTVSLEVGPRARQNVGEEAVTKGIVPAVLIAGLIFFYGQNAFARG